VSERVDLAEMSSMCDAFQATLAASGPEEIALRTPGGSLEITWPEYGERVRSIAGGLATLGVGHGDTVGLMLVNRPEFNLCDTAALHLGATPFSIYNTSSPEQIAYLFGNAGNRIVITEPQFLERLLEARGETALERIVLIEGDHPDALPLPGLEAAPPPPGFDFEASWRAVSRDDVATLIYTSGTTGPPKGVEITHGNLLAELAATSEVLPVERGDRMPSYLPSAHIADRWLSHYGSMAFGLQITSVDDPRAIAAALPDVRPTVWGGVPRIWEKIMAALQAQGVEDPSALSGEQRAGVLARIGLDQVRWSVSGAAPIPVEVLEYFLAMGLPICELWGMSELSCCATINPPGDIRIGTVGTAIPGLEVSLAEDGELLCRGDIVMRGYRDDPEKTADAIDPEGWLHTGDIAEIDEDGYVKIVDRKKELIINAAGKNMSPANIEQRLKSASPLIGQAVAIGDRRPYNVALLVLDPDACTAYAKENGGEGTAAALSDDDRVRATLDAAIEEANSHLSRVEQIKRFDVLPIDWEPGGDELTPTSKLKRKPIAEKYAIEIESLYA
jgi:long-chain acyl-CoA synthetase